VKQPKRSLRLDAIDSMIPTQENFQLDFTERVRSAVQATIQVILDEELERLVGAGPYERSDQRVDVRNGRYDRHVVTTAGEVAVRVGRTRAGGAATAPLGRSTTPSPCATHRCTGRESRRVQRDVQDEARPEDAMQPARVGAGPRGVRCSALLSGMSADRPDDKTPSPTKPPPQCRRARRVPSAQGARLDDARHGRRHRGAAWQACRQVDREPRDAGAKRLEDQVDELRRQRITEPFAYLYLDATFVDARWARSVENVSALVAYGIGTDNKRHWYAAQHRVAPADRHAGHHEPSPAAPSTRAPPPPGALYPSLYPRRSRPANTDRLAA
jgi:hypothetical protein